MNTSAVQSAFVEAGHVLGIRFEPSVVAAGFTSIGLVHSFGSPRGTLIFGIDQSPTQEALAQMRATGYFYSLVSESYERFDEEHFRGTLNDWGFFGPSDSRPNWYTGKKWS